MKKINLIFLLVFTCIMTVEGQTLQTVTNQGSTTTNRLALLNGAVFESNNLWLKGGTMGYRDPLRITPNLDNSGIVLEDAAIRFDQEYDRYDQDGSSLVFHYAHSGIPYYRRYGTDFTILKIWSPPNNKNAYESSLALVNGNNDEEFLNLYNMNYPNNQSFGIRLQKRGTGSYKDFHFEYADGSEIYKVMSLSPDKSTRFHGKVGIGTSPNQNYNLSVSGKILAESIDIKTASAWPDYVFEDGYELMDLKEVEEYIKVNNSLPRVPKAAEVSSNGYNVGDMDILLLEKIEEITLYIIAQNKLLEKIQIENESLREEIKNLRQLK